MSARVDDQDEVGTGRDASSTAGTALSRTTFASNAALLLALAVQRDLDHRLQAVAEEGGEALGIEDGDLPLDQTGAGRRFTRRRQVGGETCTRLARSWLLRDASVWSLLQQGNVHWNRERPITSKYCP